MDVTSSTMAAALTAIGGGVAGAFAAWLLNYLQSSGNLTITWRPREDGFPTIDVIVRNAGQRRLKNIEITAHDKEFTPIEFNELPAGAEHRIHTLAGRSQKHEYCTRHGWRRRLPWSKTKWYIDPPKFAGVKIGTKTAAREIADTLESIEKQIRDSPVIRNIGNTASISTPNRENWILPAGVLAVLVPDTSETKRTHIQETTEMGSAWRQRRATGSSAGTHAPREIMRIVIDQEEISDDDANRLREYLDDDELTLYWNREHWPIAKYRIRTMGGRYRAAQIIERDVEYMQVPGEEDESPNG